MDEHVWQERNGRRFKHWKTSGVSARKIWTAKTATDLAHAFDDSIESRPRSYAMNPEDLEYLMQGEYVLAIGATEPVPKWMPEMPSVRPKKVRPADLERRTT